MAYVCEGYANHDWVSDVNDDEIITYCAQCGTYDSLDYIPDSDYDTTYEMDRDLQWDA